MPTTHEEFHVSLTVIGFTPPGTKDAVVLQSSHDGSAGHEFSLALGELRDMGARSEALRYAAREGIQDPGTGMPSNPYPVDDKGEVFQTDPKDPSRRPTRYRIDVPIVSGGI